MEQRSRAHGALLFLLWSTFLILMGVIIYLSIQDGIAAKEQMYKIVEYLQEYTEVDLKAKLGIATGDKDQIAYLLRQSGRVAAFFLLGILGTVSVHMTFKKMNWFAKTCITSFALVAIAYCTEKIKEYLPTRHFSREEMLFSIMAVVLGFLLVSAVTLLYHLIKCTVRLIARCHN